MTASAIIRSIVERVERLDEEIKELNADKSEVYKEAKSNGLDVKALKDVIRLRRKDPGERMEHETVVGLYLSALGMTIAGETGTPIATRTPAPPPREFDKNGMFKPQVDDDIGIPEFLDRTKVPA